MPEDLIVDMTFKEVVYEPSNNVSNFNDLTHETSNKQSDQSSKQGSSPIGLIPFPPSFLVRRRQTRVRVQYQTLKYAPLFIICFCRLAGISGLLTQGRDLRSGKADLVIHSTCKEEGFKPLYLRYI